MNHIYIGKGKNGYFDIATKVQISELDRLRVHNVTLGNGEARTTLSIAHDRDKEGSLTTFFYCLI